MKIAQKRLGVVLVLFSCIIALALASCGESSDETPPPEPAVENLPPVAVITTHPAEAIPREVFYLDGSGSTDAENGGLTFAWTQISGVPVELQNQDQAEASFTVPDETTTLQFQLIVTDDDGMASEPVTVDVSVISIEERLNAIYVSATLGSDDPGNDGSADKPVATINHGIDLAVRDNRATVYVMEETYVEEVHLASGISVVGNVASWDNDGMPSFEETANRFSVIRAPANSPWAVLARYITSAKLSGFNVIGSADLDSSTTMVIDSASAITVENNTLTTPGKTGGQCHDIEIKGSDNVSLYSNTFLNSGICNGYIAVTIEDGESISISDKSGKRNYFNIMSGGDETVLKAVSAVNSDNIEIKGSVIRNVGGLLDIDTVFQGILVSDVSNATIKDNTININGASTATGIYVSCENLVTNTNVEHNSVDLSGSSKRQTGVGISCALSASVIGISRNTMSFLPDSNVSVDTRGIDLTALMRPITLNVINNNILMPAAIINDTAVKNGIYLKMLGAASNLSFFYNTILVTGNSGELHSILSSQGDLKFKLSGNILMVYGGNSNNSFLSTPQACEANNCAKDIVTNLFNGKYYRGDVSLSYHPDTFSVQSLADVNACDANPQPSQCVAGTINHSGNIIDTRMKPSYFDFVNGELFLMYQSIAKDKGRVLSEVTVDVNEKARDNRPDIGAVEY